MLQGDASDDAASRWAERLRAIAYPTRLRLLALLSEPHTLSELETVLEPQVRLQGEDSEPPAPEDHPIAREPITVEGNRQETGKASAPLTWGQPPSSVPSLTVVHGGPLGRSFRLDGRPNDPRRGWVIGCGEAADIQLRDDERAAREAGDLERSEGSFQLVDLRTAPSRVSVNGQALDRGETRGLEDGDLVGVGRVLLHFRGG